MATKTVVLEKDSNNLIGISIGGGAPSPCVYIVQVFDDTPAAREGSLSAGDEIIRVGDVDVRGMARTKLANLILSHSGEVSLTFIKLRLPEKPGHTLDINLKKLKHRMVEQMSSSAADALGLSRAILVNDRMVKKIYELSELGRLFYGFMSLLNKYLKHIYDLSRIYRAFGEVFADIGVHEPQTQTSEAFTLFANAHRDMEKYAFTMLRKIKPMVNVFKTFIQKVIPDTQMTFKRYMDVKYEYLSYCLKVKEMDDEENELFRLSDTFRSDSDTYEYRCNLRHRQDCRIQFAKLRNDVLVKIELVDNKHVQDMSRQLGLLITAINGYQRTCQNAINQLSSSFPFEVDLSSRLSAQNEPVCKYVMSELDGNDADDECASDVEDLESLGVGDKSITKGKEGEFPAINF